MSDTFHIERAVDWDQIIEASEVQKKCIRLGGPNNIGGKRTWDMYHEDESVVYFLVYKPAYGAVEGDVAPLAGYVRLFLVAGSIRQDTATWVADYVCPSSFQILIEISKLLPGTILAKAFIAGDSDVVADCPRLLCGFPRLDHYPYHIQGSQESTYVVVVPALARTTV